MLNIFEAQSDRDDYCFLFPVDLTASLMVLQKKIRTEERYDADCTPETTAFLSIKSLAKALGLDVYLLSAEPYPELPTRSRTWKGLFWHFPKLRALKIYEQEMTLKGGYTRLVALVDLRNDIDKLDEDTANTIFYYPTSIIILTSLLPEQLTRFMSDWVSKQAKENWPIDYQAIANDLKDLKNIGVLRYFSAHDGYPETVAIMGHKDFLMKKVKPCLEEMKIE